jgi:hypothetical protein
MFLVSCGWDAATAIEADIMVSYYLVCKHIDTGAAGEFGDVRESGRVAEFAPALDDLMVP